jgi:2-polyprenyl-6-methoxyphenol hydroxylase-like FAD-dependent oxidoreductase
MAAGDPNILIVGAGPTGLTAGVEFARRGLRPRIIDQKEGPTQLSKAVGISPHSLDILDASGVGQRLLAEGVQVRHVCFRYEKKELGMIDFSIVPHRFNFLLSLPQSRTEAIMADVLAKLGVSVEWETALVGLAQGNESVDTVLESARGREEASFDFVFGADGVHSKVRESIGIPFEGRTHQRPWSIADVELSDWPYEPEAAQLFLHANGNVGFVIPIGVDRFRAVANTEDALANISASYQLRHCLRRDTFHIPVRQATSYQKGPIFLGGDAAHVHSPVGGRGMNLGIEDAAAFARRFVDDELEGYTDERWPIGHRWINLSERILAAAQSSNPLVATARNLALRVIGHTSMLQGPLLVRMAGLKE